MSDRTDLYASAFLSLVRAEGSGNEVLDELFRVSRTIEGNDELRTALSDPHLPADRRTQIVQDLLEGKAHALTISLVSTTITNGRVRDLPIIVDSMLARNAATGDKVVAQVRSAVALTDAPLELSAICSPEYRLVPSSVIRKTAASNDSFFAPSDESVA